MSEVLTLRDMVNARNGAELFPYQDEAEERILEAVEARINEKIAEDREIGGPLSAVKSVMTGEYSEDLPLLPLVWIQDAEVRASSDSTMQATAYEMDLFIRVEVDGAADAKQGQREARALATRVRDTLLKSGSKRLGLNFLRIIKPWRSQRMGEVSEGTYGHYAAVRVHFMARE